MGHEDARIQRSTHESEDMRMWGCKDPSKYTRNWGHDDAEIQAEHMNLKIRGYKDPKFQASTHKHKDIRMQECEDTSKWTET